MDSFSDSISKLLNPATRGNGAHRGERAVKFVNSFGKEMMGLVDVTTKPSYLKLPVSYIPGFIPKFLVDKRFIQKDPSSSGDYVFLGPIPAGVPINLISNIDLTASLSDLKTAILALYQGVENARVGHGGDAARNAFMLTAGDALLKVSKCKDFVVNRGHYFGTEFSKDGSSGKETPMNDTEKTALVEFIKTM